MQTATLTVIMDKFGSTQTKYNVTPAEAAILAASFAPLCQKLARPVVDKSTGKRVGEYIFKGLWKGKDRNYNSKELRDYLTEIYRTRNTENGSTEYVVNKLFPGVGALPETFAELGFVFDEGVAPERQPKSSKWTPTYKTESAKDETFAAFNADELDKEDALNAPETDEAVIV